MSRNQLKSITVLKLKISWCDTELEEVASVCRRARNIAVEDWLLRQRGKPESERQATRQIKRKDIDPNKEKSEGQKMYDAIVDSVPELGTGPARMISSNLNSHLNAKVDWRKQGEEEEKIRRKDTILKYEDRPPFFHKLEIPIDWKACKINFGDKFFLSVRGLLRGLNTTIEISLKGLPARFKKILGELAWGDRRLADSKFVLKDGNWYWHVPIAFEQPEADQRVSVTIKPVIPSQLDKDPERFFFITKKGERDWGIGDGRYLVRQVKRMQMLIKQIGWRYRNRNGAGHGRKKIDRAVSKRRTQLRNIVDEVRRRAISDIVKYARKHNAGVVIYHKPTNPVKTKCWFDEAGVDWDWTRFESDLKNSLARHGIKLTNKSLKMKEIKEQEDKNNNG